VKGGRADWGSPRDVTVRWSRSTGPSSAAGITSAITSGCRTMHGAGTPRVDTAQVGARAVGRRTRRVLDSSSDACLGSPCRLAYLRCLWAYCWVLVAFVRTLLALVWLSRLMWSGWTNGRARSASRSPARRPACVTCPLQLQHMPVTFRSYD
jgi:hypothetical protein